MEIGGLSWKNAVYIGGKTCYTSLWNHISRDREKIENWRYVFMNELRGACIIGQSGGPTSVINASAYGVIRTALDSGVINNVYDAAHGIKGVLNDQLYDMGQ